MPEMPPETPITFRRARAEDVPAIVHLLADDPLGRTRERDETPLPASYAQAFAAIDADANQELVVAGRGPRVVGVLQLTYLPSLTHQGSWRAQIEGVRVAAPHRGQGLGRTMIEWAIGQAREHGCGLVQLTSDKRRHDAVRFYESLGFTASHEGLKLPL